MKFEYKCPHCGHINVRDEEYGRLVCEQCGKEFVPDNLKAEVHHHHHHYYYYYYYPYYPYYPYTVTGEQEVFTDTQNIDSISTILNAPFTNGDLLYAEYNQYYS